MRFLIPVLMSVLLAACTSTRERLLAGLPPPCAVESATAAAQSGQYLVSISGRDIGTLQTRLSVALDPSGRMLARSRTDGASAALGSGRAVLAGLMTDRVQGGSLMTIYANAGPTHEGGTPLRGAASTPLGVLEFRGTLRAGAIEGEFLGRRSGAPWGTLRGVPDDRGGAALADYASLASRAQAAAAGRIYDPRTQTTPSWKQFWAAVQTRLGRAHDDLEAVVGFSDAARTLGVSHLALLREIPEPKEGPAAPVEIKTLSGGAVLLRPGPFLGKSQEIDRVVAGLPQPVPALIIDLRGNPGGDLSSMRLASHLLSTSTDAGVFVGAKWWAGHDNPPLQADTVPVLTEPSVDEFRRLLQDHGAVRGRVEPVPPLLRCPVYVLIDGGTASAAEPLAALLKDTKRATLVGEPTAGAMLSSERVALEGGWTLVLPAADYYTAAGVRLEGRGVQPDLRAPSAEALDRALAVIRGS